MAGGKRNAVAAPLHRERRRHPRAATSFSAHLDASGRRHAALIVNLSMGGALLDFHDADPRPEIEVGGRVAIHINCRAIRATFVAEGRAVMWNTTSAPQPLLAIQFDEVTGETAELLEALLAEALVDLGRFKAPSDIP
jgi:hypothetical protein